MLLVLIKQHRIFLIVLTPIAYREGIVLYLQCQFASLFTHLTSALGKQSKLQHELLQQQHINATTHAVVPIQEHNNLTAEQVCIVWVPTGITSLPSEI